MNTNLSKASPFSNPAKPELERHGIIFPSCGTSFRSLLMRCAPETLEEEKSQMEMVLQHSLLKSQQHSSSESKAAEEAISSQEALPSGPPVFGYPFYPEHMHLPTAPSSSTSLCESGEETDAAHSLLALKSTRKDNQYKSFFTDLSFEKNLSLF